MQFQKNFIDFFPGDQSSKNHQRMTPESAYCLSSLNKFNNLKLLHFSDNCNELFQAPLQAKQLIEYINNPSQDCYASNYGGHQFGHWAGQLGDGRAHYLGELCSNPKLNLEVQLKGSGLTPYSRRGDGNAVLRSSLREHLASEALHHLGVSTTRSLALMSTGNTVIRDPEYNGQYKEESGALVCRVAPSFLRFGHLEMAHFNNQLEIKNAYFKWLIDNYYPDCKNKEELLHAICIKTAELFVHWMRIGFTHGVLNTDNMSLLGLSIDYGPFSFLDEYDPLFTPNTTDLPGRRYAFGRQASIGLWNLQKVAQCFELSESQMKDAFESYQNHFTQGYLKMWANKMGLQTISDKSIVFIEAFLKDFKIDYTLFFSTLEDWLKSNFELSQESQINQLQSISYLKNWNAKQLQATSEFIKSIKSLYDNEDNQSAIKLMTTTNPKFILRNYLLYEAIEEYEKEKSLKKLNTLYDLSQNPYQKDSNQLRFYQKKPEWANNLFGAALLSCSS